MTMPKAAADHPHSPLSFYRPPSESRVFSIVLSSSQLSCFLYFFHLFSSSLPSTSSTCLGSSSPPPRPNTIPFRPAFLPQFLHVCHYDPLSLPWIHPPFLPIILTLNSDANPSHLSPSCIYTSSLFAITFFPPHRLYLFVFPVRYTLPGAYSGVAYLPSPLVIILPASSSLRFS